MSAVRGGEETTLSGPPRNMKGVVRLEAGGERVVPVDLKLPDGPSIQRAYLRAQADGAQELRMKLPGETPPGTYEGTATVGDVSIRLVVDVAPVLLVEVEPSLTPVSAEPGGRTAFEIRVANRGNVGVEIPERSPLDLDAEDQDRALGRALRAQLDEGQSRVDRFFEELRESHGGEAHVSVLEGAGPLGPGDSRTLRCQLDVPMTAAPGRAYTGSWELGGAGHSLLVEVRKPESDTPRTRRRKTE